MTSEAKKRANKNYYEKKKEELANKWKKLSVSAEVHELVNQQAKQLHLSVSEYLLKLIDGSLR